MKTPTTLLHTLLPLLMFALGACAVRAREPVTSTERASQREEVFILGADISWIPEDEDAGATYYDQGEKREIFKILTDHGFNYVRLRVFVDPTSETGYGRGWRRNVEDPKPWCGLEKTLEMARRAKQAGMGTFICFHLSDSWADPEHQPKPSAWRDMSVEEMEQAVHDHVHEVLAALVKQGTKPGIVQVGNEITHGTLWPEGRVGSKISSGNPDTDANMAKAGIEGLGNYDNLSRFLKSGIKAVREIDPTIEVAVHNHLGRHRERMVEWMDNLLSRGVEFDLIAMSFYSQSTEGDWKRTIDDLALRYPDHDLLVAEYSAQKRYINDLINNAPHGKGRGSFIWEPTRHREALFDQDGWNMGGGQESNFVAIDDVSVNQGQTAPQAEGAPPRPRRPRLDRGGRYDANDYMDLYPTMSKAYNGDSTPAGKPQQLPEGAGE